MPLRSTQGGRGRNSVRSLELSEKVSVGAVSSTEVGL